MAIKIQKKYGGTGEVGEGKFLREVEYNIIGTTDEDLAMTTFRQWILNHAAYKAGLPLERLKYSGNEDGAKHFTGTAIYSNRQRRPKDVGIPHYSFSTKGGTAKVMFGRRVAGVYGPDPPNFGTGINFVRDKGFEGVDIVVPKWTKFVKVAYPRTFVDYRYEGLLRRLSGCMNSHPFLGMAPGECFFNGVESSEGERTDDNGQNLTEVYELTFEFLGMPNVLRNIPGVGMVEKRGWDYVWVHNEEVPDETSSRLVSYPKNAYVIQTYDEVDFNVFGF